MSSGLLQVHTLRSLGKEMYQHLDEEPVSEMLDYWKRLTHLSAQEYFIESGHYVSFKDM